MPDNEHPFYIARGEGGSALLSGPSTRYGFESLPFSQPTDKAQPLKIIEINTLAVYRLQGRKAGVFLENAVLRGVKPPARNWESIDRGPVRPRAPAINVEARGAARGRLSGFVTPSGCTNARKSIIEGFTYIRRPNKGLTFECAGGAIQALVGCAKEISVHIPSPCLSSFSCQHFTRTFLQSCGFFFQRGTLLTRQAAEAVA